MLDKEDLLAIAQLMDAKLENVKTEMSIMMDTKLESVKTEMSIMMDTKLEPITQQLNKMQENIDILKEDSAITRSSVNTLLDWAEDAQIEVKIPLYKKAAL